MIEFTDVTKRFGHTTALSSVSLQISGSGLYCLLGGDEQEKTALMRLLAGHIKPSSGTVAIDGCRVSRRRARNRVSFIEEDPPLLNMRAGDLIDASADFVNGFDRDFAREMSWRWGISWNVKFRSMPSEMKVTLTAILSMAGDAGIIMLSERALGTDTDTRRRLCGLLAEGCRLRPRVVIISTRFIDEAVYAADNLVIIHNGRILLAASANDIGEHAYTLTGPAETIFPLIKDLNCIGKNFSGHSMAAHIYGERIEPPNDVTLEPLSLRDFYILNVVGIGGYEQ